MLTGIELLIGIFAPIAALVALFVAFLLAAYVSKKDVGDDKMKEIASYIHRGAMTFLKREYKVMVIVVIIVALILWVLIDGFGIPRTAILYIFGAFFSVLAGFFGMSVATKGNVRTAAAAKTSGPGGALKIAFRSGAVMGLCVSGLGLLGVSLILIFLAKFQVATVITGFGLGASSMAIFGRVGGGIYTKAADVGADLVGKVEKGIPEDDPRNPAVIADNVGDNVGDVAGMGSDLFESYVGAIISAITLAFVLPEGTSGSLVLGKFLLPEDNDFFHITFLNGALFPVTIAATGLLASVIGIFFVRGGKNPANSLNLGTYVSSILVLLVSVIVSFVFFKNINPALAIISGVLVGLLIGKITEVYTSGDYKHVKHIAKQSETGEATTIISGISIGMLSTVWPIICIAIAIFLAHGFSGLYGIALAAVGMLSTTGMVVAVYAYGPVADNAGGIAEMSGQDANIRKITDKLDAVGNTTAAIGKGFAIGSAALTALALFCSYAMTTKLDAIDLLQPNVVIGMFIGGMLPFLFSAWTMSSVGKAANQMINEVRRQFREDRGIIEGISTPDYEKCVDISTSAALKEMMRPGLLAIIAPLVVGFVFGAAALGGLLAGALVTGVLLAIMMANAGGAWDNAKKHIEEGNFGGKGSNTHKATVVGDTVGDPFKDTSGPSINILIKLMTIVSLVFAPIILKFSLFG
ncbi:MAG: sodium-translocating pyrophosphatase [Clostridiales Family XIII bacterium]|jgi:K(+)-stimulated pyrophosphate-energized sodium pump|nr:sodium-translocating pyrophosphatase [Clostridiales Family XIII bacterium]